ncbi:RDD family protein [Alkalicoccus urumqiensis]|uniref:RDD family protein n=1 Tax=Alkalicoccus urumqiensis TaxID=1548213 RepID=A0A2P6MHM1_ALKUR|nr:RDD family protein [Alkalicoccus urumqiensis]PRO65795.1 RDD family protein [Alkalicoccus urumqiensis]
MYISEPVGFWQRLGALLVDAFLILIVISVTAFIVYGSFAAENQGLQAFEGLVTLLYNLVLPPMWYGYTVGKRALGIRIAKEDGTQVTVFTMFMRYIVSGIVYLLTLGIGAIVSIVMIIVRKDHRAIHDFIAGTYVTSTEPDGR